MERIVISDTNIFIDLWTMRLVWEFFMLPCEIHTVDMVIREIEFSDQKETITNVIKMGKLVIDQTTSENINDVVNLMKGNLSITDAAIWYHTKKRSAMMLTGDNRLRKLAKMDNIRVGGILFIMDRLVEYNIISAGYAAECLESLKEINKRLPQTEVEHRLKKWTQIIRDKEDKAM